MQLKRTELVIDDIPNDLIGSHRGVSGDTKWSQLSDWGVCDGEIGCPEIFGMQAQKICANTWSAVKSLDGGASSYCADIFFSATPLVWLGGVVLGRLPGRYEVHGKWIHWDCDVVKLRDETNSLKFVPYTYLTTYHHDFRRGYSISSEALIARIALLDQLRRSRSCLTLSIQVEQELCA